MLPADDSHRMTAHNFLFVSADAALIVDLAWPIHREGHDARYYVEAESDREIADGFVPKTDDWRGELEWADVVIFDDIWIAGSDQRGGSRGKRSGTRPGKIPTGARTSSPTTRWVPPAALSHRAVEPR
jgi:phosphoribosylamine--glycine ligase